MDSERWSFVHTGPGTLAGRYLRRSWQPVYESARLASGRAVRIAILGDHYTLYRDDFGATHVVADVCPHRSTRLSIGRVEGDRIACFYHGWTFAPSGQCVAQPAEPQPFCDKIQIASAPTTEALGLVFVYLGEGEPPPPLSFPEFEHENAVASIQMIPCNYFQSAENIMDDVHVGFTHRAVGELAGTDRGAQPPRVSAEETPYGLVGHFKGDAVDEKNLWLMPNTCCVGYDLQFPTSKRLRRVRMRTLFWYVPIDDVSHLHVMVTVPSSWLVANGMRRENDLPHDVAGEIERILRGESRAHIEVTPPEQRIPDLIRVQDGVSVAAQGRIVDRGNDRLGASDAAVILLRKIWQRELQLLREGKPLTAFRRPNDLLALVSGTP